MLLQWSAPEYMPHSFQVSGLSGTVGHKQTGNCFDLTKQVADGFVGMQELSKGLFLVQSEMAFKRETELYEEYPERKVFQLSFCMNGICEWDYRQKQGEHYQLSPTQCSLQCGTFSQCVSHFGSEQPYHTLSISLEEGRFSSLTEDLEAAHLIRRDDKICTHVFSTTPEIRLVLQQLLDCPPERKLRKLYLEGKIRTRSYDDSRGIKRYITELFVDNMEMLSVKPQQAPPPPPLPEHTNNQTRSAVNECPPPPPPTKDDLPF